MIRLFIALLLLICLVIAVTLSMPPYLYCLLENKLNRGTAKDTEQNTDMRKLILTSIKGKTGDLIWEEDRLVVVNHNQGDVEEDLLKKAAAHAKNWLKTERPNSEYLAIVPKATIGEPAEEPQRDIEMFGRQGMIEFGNYILGKAFARGETVVQAVKSEDIDDWLASIKQG